MGEVYFLIGFIVFWSGVMIILYFLAGWTYDNVWKKIRHRVWIYQAWETFLMWYNWVYKKQDYKGILHWGVVEKIRDRLDTQPHLFKRFWIRRLDHMLASQEYKRYRYRKLESED